MIIPISSRALLAVAMLAAVSLTPARAVPTLTNAKPVAKPVAPTKLAAPAAIVNLGDAMQEEYHGGDPSRRITVYLSGDAARGPKAAAGEKKSS